MDGPRHGGSAISGLLRTWEVQATTIDHALAPGIEAVLVVAAVANRELIPLAIVWPIVVGSWQWQVGRAPTGWALQIDERAIREVTGDERRSIERDATSVVRFRRRRIRHAAWTSLQAVGPGGTVDLEVVIRDEHRDGIAAALRERGWQVED